VWNLVSCSVVAELVGQEGDSVNVRVKGSLPVRDYAWRNDRTQPLITGTVQDSVVQIKVELDRNYSAVKLTDESKAFGFDGSWGDIFERQTDALVNYNENKIAEQVLGAPYEVIRHADNSAANLKTEAEINRDPIFNAFADA